MSLPYNNRHLYKVQYGFTLFELLCALVIIGIISIFTINGFINCIKGYNFGRSVSHIEEKTQLALMRMILEFSDINTSSMPSTTTNSITYESSDGTSHSITLTGTNIMYDTHILCDNVSSFTPSYTDSSKLITISLVVTLENNIQKTFSTETMRP